MKINNNIQIDEQDLHELYYDYDMSQRDIANWYGVKPWTILRRMEKYGFERRTKSEVQLNWRAKNRGSINVPIIIDYLDGLMLGDGHLQYGNFTSLYAHRCKHKDWLDCIQIVFEAADIESTITSREPPYTGYNLLTKSYPELLKQRQRWYPEGVKIVPEDVSMSSESVANWYMGDGGCNKKKGFVEFYTNCFTHEEVIFLSDYLNTILDIESHPQKHRHEQYTIYIPKRYAPTLFKYMEPYILECYAYKLGTLRIIK